MKIKTWKRLILSFMAALSMWSLCDIAYAAENYTTVTVNAVDDESGVFRYAIDATDESSWQESNVFYVQPGTTHTIYVKDAAGNITSSEVYAEEIQSANTSAVLEEEAESTVTSESVEEMKAGYTYATGDGVGSVTDYVSDSSKEFYTITTANGNAFYLIIDHRNNDSNVYFTKPVSEMDLLTLAEEAGQINETDLAMTEQKGISEPESEEQLPDETEKENRKGNILTDNLPIFLVIGLLGGGYYYFMIYKKKRNAVAEYDEDAADMEQFIPVEDEDDAALFRYKGNNPNTEEDDADEYLDEFYENNADFEEDTEEEYSDSEEEPVDQQEPETGYADQNLGLEDEEPDGVEV